MVRGVAPALRPWLIRWRLPGPDCTSKPLRRAHCSCNYEQFAFPNSQYFSKRNMSERDIFLRKKYAWERNMSEGEICLREIYFWERYISERDIFEKGPMPLRLWAIWISLIDSQYFTARETTTWSVTIWRSEIFCQARQDIRNNCIQLKWAIKKSIKIFTSLFIVTIMPPP